MSYYCEICLLKGQFNNNQDCKYIIAGMIINTTNISWSKNLREAIINFKGRRTSFQSYS